MFSSAGRGQVEPLPALVAVSAFVAALGLYAGAIPTVPNADRPVEGLTLSRTVEDATVGGVLDPARLDPEPPSGYRLAIVVRANGRTWRRGPTPPADAASATTTVLVATDAGESVGRIRVWVWR